jgi:hypothetical protein
MRRRWLRPAASLVVPSYMAALALLAIAVPTGSGSGDPTMGPTLSDAQLAAKRPVASPGDPLGPSRPRLVDVVDREAPPPRGIDIPSIGVSARIVPLRRERDGTMQTPDRWEDAGWYAPGVEPGELGPALVAGHVDSAAGPAAFYRLRELRRGNEIRIRRADGSVVRFRVEGLERWPKAAFPTRRVFGRTQVAALRLVTCSGEFDSSTGHYVDNTIVYAARLPARRVVPSEAG